MNRRIQRKFFLKKEGRLQERKRGEARRKKNKNQNLLSDIKKKIKRIETGKLNL